MRGGCCRRSRPCVPPHAQPPPPPIRTIRVMSPGSHLLTLHGQEPVVGRRQGRVRGAVWWRRRPAHERRRADFCRRVAATRGGRRVIRPARRSRRLSWAIGWRGKKGKPMPRAAARRGAVSTTRADGRMRGRARGGAGAHRSGVRVVCTWGQGNRGESQRCVACVCGPQPPPPTARSRTEERGNEAGERASFRPSVPTRVRNNDRSRGFPGPSLPSPHPATP